MLLEPRQPPGIVERVDLVRRDDHRLVGKPLSCGVASGKQPELPHDDARVYARNLEVPSGGAIGTARAIARAYSAFATGGRELGLRRETIALLAEPAIPSTRGFYDECLKARGVQFSLGFMKSSPAMPFGSPTSFGSPGAGGAMGFADPEAGIGYAYVTDKMGTRLSGDPRDAPPRLLTDKVAAGELGVKAGRGFYHYPHPAFQDLAWRLGKAGDVPAEGTGR